MTPATSRAGPTKQPDCPLHGLVALLPARCQAQRGPGDGRTPRRQIPASPHGGGPPAEEKHLLGLLHDPETCAVVHALVYWGQQFRYHSTDLASHPASNLSLKPPLSYYTPARKMLLKCRADAVILRNPQKRLLTTPRTAFGCLPGLQHLERSFSSTCRLTRVEPHPLLRLAVALLPSARCPLPTSSAVKALVIL